jgi:IclR family acetate operon transcriptional repressor
MSNAPQSVERALRILRSFDAQDQEVSVAEIASLLGVHKSTASRLTATLCRSALLERSRDSGRFRLGPEIARLGLLALAGRDLLDVARGPMNTLAARTAETVTLAILDGGLATTVAEVATPHVVGTRSWLGRGTPLHTTSDGKVFLAYGSAPLPKGPLAAFTPRTHTNRSELRRELAQIRERGWADAFDELEEGLHGIAAPVLDRSGHCQAALSVSGPAYRITTESVPEIGRACAESAAQIGSLLAVTTNGTAREVIGSSNQA